jgi:hypothetical protein
MTGKIVPNKQICHKHGWQFALTMTAENAGPEDGVTTPTVVRVSLPCGCVRRYGVERAWINSALRMCCEGGFVNPRNELATAWKDATP